MDAVFAEHGMLRTVTAGNATLTNVRIRDVVAITTRLLTDDIDYLLREECRPR